MLVSPSGLLKSNATSDVLSFNFIPVTFSGLYSDCHFTLMTETEASIGKSLYWSTG